MPSDAVLLVAVRTDQPDIERRLKLILAAAQPIEKPNQAEVRAFELGHESPHPFALTSNDFERLRDLFGEDAMERLELSPVTEAAS